MNNMRFYESRLHPSQLHRSKRRKDICWIVYCHPDSRSYDRKKQYNNVCHCVLLLIAAFEGQGCVARLGGLRWGSEIHGVGQAAETALLRRDDDLCLGLADTLEVLTALLFQAHRSRALVPGTYLLRRMHTYCSGHLVDCQARSSLRSRWPCAVPARTRFHVALYITYAESPPNGFRTPYFCGRVTQARNRQYCMYVLLYYSTRPDRIDQIRHQVTEEPNVDVELYYCRLQYSLRMPRSVWSVKFALEKTIRWLACSGSPRVYIGASIREDTRHQPRHGGGNQLLSTVSTLQCT